MREQLRTLRRGEAMSHRHFCDFAGHPWECEGSALRHFAKDSEPTECICIKHEVSMEEGDHSRCPVELLVCPEHRDEQFKQMSECNVRDPIPTEVGAERIGLQDKDGNATVGFCLWCGKDFYAMAEVWEHNGSGAYACPEFQKYLSEERARTEARS
jgi:hypothetical protein